jgi:protein trunk
MLLFYRYMSIDQPPVDEELDPKMNAAGKREAQDFKPFYVDDTFAEDLSDKPAWEVMHLSELEKETQKRRLNEAPGSNQLNTTRVQRSNNRRKSEGESEQKKWPWQCEAKIKWLDLGHDYYPRYLRTVECTSHSCFYGHYTCKPRSFTVKILRRRRGECVQTKNNVGIDGLHGDLKELWIWEERAVNFCCDCST